MQKFFQSGLAGNVSGIVRAFDIEGKPAEQGVFRPTVMGIALGTSAFTPVPTPDIQYVVKQPKVRHTQAGMGVVRLNPEPVTSRKTMVLSAVPPMGSELTPRPEAPQPQLPKKHVRGLSLLNTPTVSAADLFDV